MMIFFQLHIGDWSTGTKLMSAVEKGVYIDLLVYYYSVERPITEDECKRIARAYASAEQDAMQYVLQNHFVFDGNAYRHEKCDEVIAQAKEKQADISEKRRNAAKARWNKGKSVVNGSKNEGKQTTPALQVQCKCNANEMLSINHKPLTINIDNHNNNQSTVCNEGSFEKAVDGDDCSFDPDEIVDAPVAVQAAQAQLEYFEQLADDKPLTLPQLITGCKSFGIKLAHTPKTEAIANRATVTKEVLRECVRVWKGKKVGTGYFVAILDNASRDDGTVAPKQAMPNASEPWNDPNYYNDFGESGVLK